MMKRKRPLWEYISRQERCILELAAEGHSTEDIAVRLALSDHTIEEYWRRIRFKFAARNKVHAVAIALQLGLIS